MTDTAPTSTDAARTTAGDAKEIRERSAAARERILNAALAAYGFTDTVSGARREAIGDAVEAALLEAAQVLREEADWWEAQRRRGWKTTAEQIRQAASRIAGLGLGVSMIASTEPFVPAEPTMPEPSDGEHAIIEETGNCVCGQPAGHLELEAQQAAQQTQIAADTAAHSQHLMDYLTGASNVYDPVQPPPPAPAIPAPPIPIVGTPFVDPVGPGANAPAARLAFRDLDGLVSTLAITTTSPSSLSHSSVTTYEGCGVRALMTRASRHGLIGVGRPQWSMIGGRAFHLAVQQVEQYAATAVPGGAPPALSDSDVTGLWTNSLNATIAEESEKVANSPYWDMTTWRASAQGKEGYDWWRVEGRAMLARYLDVHDAAWRAARTLLSVADPAAVNSLTPVLEWSYESSIKGDAIITTGAIMTRGVIDSAWTVMGTKGIELPTIDIIDLKSGSRMPRDHFQLDEYAAALRCVLPPNFALPIRGLYYNARKGTYSEPVVLNGTGAAAQEYRYAQVHRGMTAGVYAANPSDFCAACPFADYCPTQR